MTTLLILLIALIVIISIWAIIGLSKKPMLKEKLYQESQDTEFATELFPSGRKFETEKELPQGYGDNRIILMVRDPNWLYVYWETNETKRAELIRQYGEKVFEESQPVLRVYNITDTDFNGQNANDHFDILINDYAANWYIRVDKPDCSFCVDLGRIKQDGTFILVARSNMVNTPRNSLSDKDDPEWMMIGELMGGISYGLSSPELFGITSLSSEELIKKDEEHH